MMEIIYGILTLLVTCLAFGVIWAISVRISDAGIVDFYWAPGFLVIAATGLVLSPGLSFEKLIVLAALAVWAFQLTLYMAARHHRRTEEDARYKVWRERGGENYWWRSFYKVFMLQAVILWVLATPVHAVFGGNALSPAGPWFWLGIAVFAAGLVFEAVADFQIYRFGSKPENEGRVCAEGLWRYSRHPNYFGESVLWIGLGIAAYDISGHVYSLAGPLILTFLLYRVSGVPILEAHLSLTKEGYADYVSRTSSFIPLPPRPVQSLSEGEPVRRAG